jgi:hypothetical protein
MASRMRRLALAVVLGLALGVLSPASAEPEMVDRKVEITNQRPSGFWTSPRPATNGAYRWRLLGIGIVLASATGFLMWRLTRKANAERVARDQAR